MRRHRERMVVIRGQPLACLMCGYRMFVARRGQIQSRLLSFLNLDWLGSTTTSYACGSCGHLHEFSDAERGD